MNAPVAPLLRTKLRPPVPRRGIVARPGLAGQVAGTGSGLTLVSAAAGFGKTTVVAEGLAGHRAGAWLSLDSRDDEPSVFWAYLLAALEVVHPGVGAGARSVAESSRPSPVAIAATLLNDLDALEEDLVLVLDDYHVIASPAIHEAVGFMVEHLPPGVHLVLATRADPPLPLARLRARGMLTEIRAADLRFAPEEAAAYLNGVMDLDLSREEVGALESRTEGWIAALQLAALSMRGRDDIGDFIRGFAGDDRFVLDYLAGEVLERQPDDVRAFLLRTSILTRLTGALCDAVTGGARGGAMLTQLERANLFLVPLDARRAWYRYHHLFADVLQARLLDELPDEVAELHRRASAWSEREGDLPEAVRHALAAGDIGRAAGLVEVAAPAMRRMRQEAALGRWIDALPDDLVASRPALGLARVGVLMASGEFDEVPRLLGAVETRLDLGAAESLVGDHAGSLAAQVAMYRAALALIGGDPAVTVANADRALAATGQDDSMLRGAAAALAGLALWFTGELGSARDRYGEAILQLDRAGHVSDVLGCSLALADIQFAQGRRGDARRTLEAGLELAEANGRPRGVADMHVALADHLMESGDLEDAARHLATGEALGEHAGLPQNPYRSRVARARLRELRGDADAALALLEEAERRFDSDFSPAVRPPAAAAARLRLRMGDDAAARRWAAERGLGADDATSYVTEFEHMTLARVLRGSDPAAAERLVVRLLAAAQEGAREGSVIELLLLRAIAERDRGDADAARMSVEEALTRAEPEGWVRVFLDEGAPVRDLLRAAAAGGPAAERARRVLARDVGTAPTGARVGGRAGTGSTEQLSGREREVLRLLCSDLSGPEIARELVVSLNTVRTHTKHIYAKLGVTTRRAAVRRAAEIGL